MKRVMHILGMLAGVAGMVTSTLTDFGPFAATLGVQPGTMHKAMVGVSAASLLLVNLKKVIGSTTPDTATPVGGNPPAPQGTNVKL